MLLKKTYLNHASTVKKVSEHQMYVSVLKGAFALLALVLTTFGATRSGQEMMAKSPKLELFIALVVFFTGSVTVLLSQYAA